MAPPGESFSAPTPPAGYVPPPGYQLVPDQPSSVPLSAVQPPGRARPPVDPPAVPGALIGCGFLNVLSLVWLWVPWTRVGEGTYQFSVNGFLTAPQCRTCSDAQLSLWAILIVLCVGLSALGCLILIFNRQLAIANAVMWGSIATVPVVIINMVALVAAGTPDDDDPVGLSWGGIAALVTAIAAAATSMAMREEIRPPRESAW
jgi:hypothetical protein